MENKWSEQGITKIRQIKKDILKKKIMLSYIIDSYSWWDRAYRWGHIIFATLAPLSGLVDTATESTGALKGMYLALSCVVAVMLKIKEYINFGEIRDTAKAQAVKYSQLYERIEREDIKPDIRKQVEDEFIYWINREYSQITLVDPELSTNEKTKFIEKCKTLGITYDEDLSILQNLIHIDKIESVPDSHNLSVNNTRHAGKNKIVEKTTIPINEDIVVDISNFTHPENHPATPENHPATPENHPATPENHPATPENHPATPENHPAPPTCVHPAPPTCVHPAIINTDKHERDSFKQSLKKLNPKADMEWAIIRLHGLND
jgi:hypothetical protein